MGAMTGRGAGFCAGYGTPGYMNQMPGRGPGMMMRYGRFGGRGGGRGWRNQLHAGGFAGWQQDLGWMAPAMQPTPPTREQQIAGMQNQAEYLENALKDIRAQLKDLESQKQE